MKVYYWEGSIWKNRELQSHAVLVKVQQAACVMPPNFIMGSPIVDFQGADGVTDIYKQFGIVRVIDEDSFDIGVFAGILKEIFGGESRLQLIVDSHDVAPSPTPNFPRMQIQPDWEKELDQWLTKHKPS